MIPILYSREETAFTSRGIGTLSECISCKVTEDLNLDGAYECTLEIPYNARHFSDIITSDEARGGAIIYTTPAYGKAPQPFEIYRITMTDDGIATVNARHISRRLNNIILRPFSKGVWDGSGIPQNVNEILANIYNASTGPFTFEMPDSTSNRGMADLISDVPISAMKFLIDNSGAGLMPRNAEETEYIGEYEWDKWIIRQRKRRGGVTPINARYGVNVAGFSRYSDLNDTYNAVVPYYSRDDVTVIGDIVNQSSVDAVARAVDLTSEFDVTPTASELQAKATEIYFPNNTPSAFVVFDEMALEGGDENISINLLQTPDNTNLQAFGYAQLGDDVALDYTPFNWAYTGARVIKLTYDSLMERNDSVTISKSTKPERTYGDIIRASL